MPDEVLENSLYTLSKLLHKHFGQKVIILIDEYDVPLDKAQQAGYYDEMIILIRNLFGQALKTNPSLFFAVLTGCLPITAEEAPSPLGSKGPRQVDEVGFPAKLENTSLSSQCQSIFTGINNFKVFSIANVQFHEHFGFTDQEIRAMLDHYHLTDKYSIIREWYDGYQFGDMDVYCPWDVINYLDLLRFEPDTLPRAFWINTSGNDIIRRFLRMAKSTTRRELEDLVDGGTIDKKVIQELTYRDLYKNIDHMWSVLFTTGYLTQRGKPDGDIFHLAIPNLEIKKIFMEQILEWFQEEAARDMPKLDALCDAFARGDAEGAERQFTAYLKKTISIRDTSVRKDKKDYTARLLEDGMETIHRYGVACWKKGCRIMSGADPSVQRA